MCHTHLQCLSPLSSLLRGSISKIPGNSTRHLSKKTGGSSAVWLSRHVRDPYVKAANAQDLRSRSAFKLMQLQEKHRIIQPEHTVRRRRPVPYRVMPYKAVYYLHPV